MEKRKKIFFASDAHLGMAAAINSLEREKMIVKWLDEIKEEAEEIYLLGDIFDYWFEYRKVVPRGFTRLLGKVAEITDSGIPVHYFTGNHDVWVFDYLPSEIGVMVHTKPLIKTIGEHKFFIAHGDGLGPEEGNYKFLKRIFTSKVFQWFWARLHPNLATAIAHHVSRRSRLAKGIYVDFLGEDNEVLIRFAKHKLAEEHFDYFVFGHRHIPLVFNLNEKSRLVFLGDWIVNFTYAVFDGKIVEMKKYDGK